MLYFGCVADDFTGASDAASFLVKGGLSVQLFNGIPGGDSLVEQDIQAVVIALKTRTQPKKEAVADSMLALQWLKDRGVSQYYLKYCSTFDSTPEGNIGPIADAAMELLEAPYTILCPALPVNGRVVVRGGLYVNCVPLHESSMKNHPLTPMRDFRIAKLMEPQSRYSCLELWREEDGSTDGELMEMLLKKSREGKPFYVIPDYRNEEDGQRIAAMFGGLRLLTGGSGLLKHLAEREKGRQTGAAILNVQAPGGALLLAGSCSQATLDQINYFREQGGISYKLNPRAMLAGSETWEDAWRFVEENKGNPVLVYSSDTAENVKEAQMLGMNEIAVMLEEAAAALAKRAMDHGIRRIIVAGGETSGAVTKKLGFSAYRIGESVAPGVPVMIPAENSDVRLILKSGNFGKKDFFSAALQMTQLEEIK